MDSPPKEGPSSGSLRPPRGATERLGGRASVVASKSVHSGSMSGGNRGGRTDQRRYGREVPSSRDLSGRRSHASRQARCPPQEPGVRKEKRLVDNAVLNPINPIRSLPRCRFPRSSNSPSHLLAPWPAREP